MMQLDAFNRYIDIVACLGGTIDAIGESTVDISATTILETDKQSSFALLDPPFSFRLL